MTVITKYIQNNVMNALKETEYIVLPHYLPHSIKREIPFGSLTDCVST